MKITAITANCFVCEWRTSAKNAMATGAIHHRKTGHEVGIEAIYVHVYKTATGASA